MKYMTETFLSIVFSGAFGFINYKILTDLNIIEKSNHNKEDKKMIITTFSAVNLLILYTIFNLILYFFQYNLIEIKFSLSIIITIFISFFLTRYILVDFLVKKTVEEINKIRAKQNLSPLSNGGNVRTIAFDRNSWRAIFIYSLNDNKLLDYGYVTCFNDVVIEDLEFVLYPFETNLTDPKQMEKYKIKNSENIRTYINTDKNIKIIIIYDWEK